MKDFLRHTKMYSKLPGSWLFIYINLYVTTFIVVVILCWGVQILRYSRKSVLPKVVSGIQLWNLELWNCEDVHLLFSYKKQELKGNANI